MIAVSLLAVVFAAAKNLPASFYTSNNRMQIEIEGVNYVTFDPIKIPRFDDNDANTVEGARVLLRRDFVTDPSLYLWAKKLMTRRSALKDIHLVTINEDGEEVSRKILKLCQPLSWTVEAADPALGGFHETIELAIQDVED